MVLPFMKSGISLFLAIQFGSKKTPYNNACMHDFLTNINFFSIAQQRMLSNESRLYLYYVLNIVNTYESRSQLQLSLSLSLSFMCSLIYDGSTIFSCTSFMHQKVIVRSSIIFLVVFICCIELTSPTNVLTTSNLHCVWEFRGEKKGRERNMVSLCLGV